MSSQTAGTRKSRRKKSLLLWAAYLSTLVIYAWAYGYFGAILIEEANLDRTTHPQAELIEAVYLSARPSEELGRKSTLGSLSDSLPRYTDGTVDPLLPWLMRRYSSAPPDTVFEKGKWFNFWLSGGLLVVLALAAAQAFSLSGALALILMGGFGVILERSGYFSSDALYFLLLVMAWLCALSLIRRNPLWLYGAFGLLLGLSYLAKPMIWPVVAGFVLVSAIRSIWEAVRHRRDRIEVADEWSASNQFVGFAMAVAAFLLVTGPRLSYAATMYGDPFHSDQKYAVWCDSLEEANAFRRDHPDRASLSALTAEEVPGPVRFIRQHGALALAKRGLSGGLHQVESSVLGRGGWLLIYGLIVFIVIGLIHRRAARHQDREVWRVRGTSARWMLLFLVATGSISLFYTGIGDPVIPHNAMTTSLFLPILVTFIWIAERYRRQLRRTSYEVLVNRTYLVLMMGAILWITIRILFSLKSPVA